MARLYTDCVPPPASLFIVLHQVQSPDNLGAVARAMANFGVERMVVSDPHIEDWERARCLAVHSEHVLEGMARVPDLKSALGDAVYVCGTTFRPEVGLRRALSPEAAVEKLHQRAKEGGVALVLGGERRGLSDEDLAECDDFLTIPTDPRQPSMNLAQSATVLLYLLSRAQTAPVAAPGAPAARIQTVQALEAVMRHALLQSGFLNPDASDYVLRELMQSLRRGGLTQREVELWAGAFRQMARVSGSGA